MPWVIDVVLDEGAHILYRCAFRLREGTPRDTVTSTTGVERFRQGRATMVRPVKLLAVVLTMTDGTSPGTSLMWPKGSH